MSAKHTTVCSANATAERPTVFFALNAAVAPTELAADDEAEHIPDDATLRSARSSSNVAAYKESFWAAVYRSIDTAEFTAFRDSDCYPF